MLSKNHWTFYSLRFDFGIILLFNVFDQHYFALLLKGNYTDFSCKIDCSVVCICKYGLRRLGTSGLYIGQSTKYHTVYESVIAVVE